MPRVLPPPQERFDPVTARWLTPGGPLHDPERGEVTADDEQVTLVDPIPRELARSFPHGRLAVGEGVRGGPSRRLRWATLAVFILGVVALLVGGLVFGI